MKNNEVGCAIILIILVIIVLGIISDPQIIQEDNETCQKSFGQEYKYVKNGTANTIICSDGKGDIKTI